GVVLIKTKTAHNKGFDISYSSNYTVRQQTAAPDFVTDGYTWASMFLDYYSGWFEGTVPAVVNKGMSFSMDYLNELKRRSNDPSLPKVEVDPSTGEYMYYGSTNWYEELYRKSSFGHDQNLSLSGGNEKARFYLTGRYMDQPGIYRYNTDTYRMYNMRAKGFLQPTPWLEIQNNISYSNMLYHEPIGSNEIMVQRGVMYDAPPMSPLYNPDGSFTLASAYGLGSHLYGKNRLNTDNRNFAANTEFTATIVKNLRIRGDFTFQNTDRDQMRIRVPVPFSKFENVTAYAGANTNDINKVSSSTSYIASNLYGE